MKRPNARRRVPLRGVLAALAAGALVSPGLFADSTAVTAPSAQAAGISHVDLRASRVVGFAPMTVVLTGMVRDGQGQRIELGPDAATRLTVVSEALSLPDGAVHTPLMSAVVPDGASDIQSDPMSLSLLLKKPGKYVVRFLVVDGGQERLSNPIELRVM